MYQSDEIFSFIFVIIENNINHQLQKRKKNNKTGCTNIDNMQILRFKYD